MPLLASQRSLIHQILVDQGFSAQEFRLSPVASDCSSLYLADLLTHQESGFYYKFDFWEGVHVYIHTPGEGSAKGQGRCREWADQCVQFHYWTSYLRRELTAKDPWAEIEAKTVRFSPRLATDTPETPFFVNELPDIRKTLGAIEGLLLSFANDNAEAQAEIKAGIGKLAHGAETQDRKTWFHTAVGFIAGMAGNMALAPEQTRQLFETLKTGLTSVIKLIS